MVPLPGIQRDFGLCGHVVGARCHCWASVGDAFPLRTESRSTVLEPALGRLTLVGGGKAAFRSVARPRAIAYPGLAVRHLNSFLFQPLQNALLVTKP